MGGIILAIVAYTLISVLLGGLLTWLAGKLLQLDELTFVNSAGLNVVFYVLNPFVPMVLFFLDYYFGAPTTFTTSNFAPTDQTIYWGLTTSVLSLVLYLAVLRFVFEWDLMQSCKFCVAQFCILVVGVVALVIILAMVFSAMGTSDRPQPESRSSQGSGERNWDRVNPSGVDLGQ